MIKIHSIIPQHCLLCRMPVRTRSGLCSGCQQSLVARESPVCRCGLALPCAPPITLEPPATVESPATSETTERPSLCGRCLNNPPPFDRLLSPFAYTWPLNRLIPRYKYQGHTAIERVLLDLWRHHPPAPLPDALVPVPLHWRRHWWRGFNQSHRLALGLSSAWNIPVLQALTRTRPTRHQQGLTAPKRYRNVAGSFRCIKPVAQRHIALVDDVVTTAATARAASQALHDAGAARIDVLALARTGE